MNLSILTFHAVEDRRSIISLSPRVFRRAIDTLRQGGVRALSLSDAVGLLRDGAPLPPRSVVITFDDGYRSVYEIAFPVLQAHDIPATVFLTTGSAAGSGPLPSLEGRAMLSWEEIREMERHGIDFGAHTCSHPDLTRSSAERLEAEVRDSKDIVEQGIGRAIACFAYPFGRYDRRVRDVVRRHFGAACSDRLGFVNAHSDLYGLERIDTYYLRTERLVGFLGTPLFPWYVRARAVPRRVRRAMRPAARTGTTGTR
jgi:peptidoglycan/xylan/chitin deacetylase (PgdA/CDA1 family)